MDDTLPLAYLYMSPRVSGVQGWRARSFSSSMVIFASLFDTISSMSSRGLDQMGDALLFPPTPTLLYDISEGESNEEPGVAIDEKSRWGLAMFGFPVLLLAVVLAVVLAILLALVGVLLLDM